MNYFLLFSNFTGFAFLGCFDFPGLREIGQKLGVTLRMCGAEGTGVV